MVTMQRVMLSIRVGCDRDCRRRLLSQTPRPQHTSRYEGRKTMEARAKKEMSARQRQEQEGLGREYEQHCAQQD